MLPYSPAKRASAAFAASYTLRFRFPFVKFFICPFGNAVSGTLAPSGALVALLLPLRGCRQFVVTERGFVSCQKTFAARYCWPFEHDGDLSGFDLGAWSALIAIEQIEAVATA